MIKNLKVGDQVYFKKKHISKENCIEVIEKVYGGLVSRIIITNADSDIAVVRCNDGSTHTVSTKRLFSSEKEATDAVLN